jgi:hypothetical protein
MQFDNASILQLIRPMCPNQSIQICQEDSNNFQKTAGLTFKKNIHVVIYVFTAAEKLKKKINHLRPDHMAEWEMENIKSAN